MKTVTLQTLADLTGGAATRPRQRANLNLHDQLSDPIQRMINAGQPSSYVRPHRHEGLARWEMFSLLQGSFDVVTFDQEGRLESRTELRQDGCLVIEIAGQVWHSLLFLGENSALLEIKPGPYQPASDKDFASWAPEEGDADVSTFLTWMKSAPLGALWSIKK